ncbi:MAG: luciferase family protein [Propionibacteriaceae bacterium]|jgi:luciferase family oxidoreductase group 1|nr:luciferase family protein [Propionibacteriaceae bacterium]
MPAAGVLSEGMSDSIGALSVLDLVTVREGQSTADALRATTSLAKVADEIGYRRYWVAEHHNMPAVAATNPPVLIGMLAAQTERIRVGSGGVMLPNHAPLVIAEQFSLLEAAFPGRIDLGIGRAPGSDPVTSWALRSGAGRTDEDITRFPDYVSDVIALMDAEGIALNLQGRHYGLKATPHAESTPEVWLLGSSDFSARLAAAKGLPYVFAHHFSGQGTAEAIELYRSSFQPSDLLAEPRTFLTVNAVVAERTELAERLALPQLLAMLSLRTGGPLAPQLSVEEAERVEVPAQHLPMLNSMKARWVIGSADEAARQLDELARTFGVDEVMINPAAGAFADTSADRTPAKEDSLRLLADRLLG